MKNPVYMDCHATTPVDPAVLEAMLPYYQSEFGNPSSAHHDFGHRAEKAVSEARTKLAHMIHARDADEIVFTSGATESDNLAVLGLAHMYRERGRHIITTSIEHAAVLEPCRKLEAEGFEMTYLPVTRDGLVTLQALEAAIRKDTILISIIFAHNEIGTIQPIAEIGEIARKHNIFFHTDAAQAVGKVTVDVQTMKIDMLSFSAHKMYGPKGIGALYVRKENPRVRLEPILCGGGQERGFRAGTLNVPGIVGFAKAAEISEASRISEGGRVLSLRERLRAGICTQLRDIDVNGSLVSRLAGNLNLSFGFVEGGALLGEITKEIAVSTGSACSSASKGPSYTLKALGLGDERVHTSIRFGLGRFTTKEEVDFTVKRIVEIVRRLRNMSPLYKARSKEEFEP